MHQAMISRDIHLPKRPLLGSGVGSEPTVLVTGGTGIVGRSLVKMLTAAGYSVRVFSRGGGRPWGARISICHGDLNTMQHVRTAMQGITAVFHCAAEKNHTELMKDVNVSATRLLFDIATDSQVQFFCHLSSVGVIGRTHLRMVDECTPCNPMDEYENTKFQAEEIVSEGIDRGRVVILRPTNIFSRETLQSWFSNSWTARMQILVKGNENAHLVYVKDVAAAALHLFEALPARRVEKYIISSDQESGNTIREVHAYLASRMTNGVRRPVVSLPLIIPYCLRWMKHRQANRGDIVYSARKIQDAGFRFQYGLHIGLCDAINTMVESSSVH